MKPIEALYHAPHHSPDQPPSPCVILAFLPDPSRAVRARAIVTFGSENRTSTDFRSGGLFDIPIAQLTILPGEDITRIGSVRWDPPQQPRQEQQQELTNPVITYRITDDPAIERALDHQVSHPAYQCPIPRCDGRHEPGQHHGLTEKPTPTNVTHIRGRDVCWSGCGHELEDLQDA